MIIEELKLKNDNLPHTNLMSVETITSFMFLGENTTSRNILIFLDIRLPDKDYKNTSIYIDNNYIHTIKGLLKEHSPEWKSGMKLYLGFNMGNRCVLFRYFTKKKAEYFNKGPKGQLIGRDMPIQGVPKIICLKIFSDDKNFTTKLKLVN